MANKVPPKKIVGDGRSSAERIKAGGVTRAEDGYPDTGKKVGKGIFNTIKDGVAGSTPVVAGKAAVKAVPGVAGKAVSAAKKAPAKAMKKNEKMVKGAVKGIKGLVKMENGGIVKAEGGYSSGTDQTGGGGMLPPGGIQGMASPRGAPQAPAPAQMARPDMGPGRQMFDQNQAQLSAQNPLFMQSSGMNILNGLRQMYEASAAQNMAQQSAMVQNPMQVAPAPAAPPIQAAPAPMDWMSGFQGRWPAPMTAAQPQQYGV